MKRVLVTGGTGFIGHQTLPLLLERGFEVHAVSRSSPEGEHVRWHCADLLEPGAAERLVAEVRPTHLLHLAWFAVPGEYWASPENVRWVEASLALTRAFSGQGGRRAVFAGTCAEYDWTQGVCREEETPLVPRALYGACKNALREIVAAYAGETGLSAAWGRIFFLYGPREHPARLVSFVIRALLTGEEAPLSHGRQIRDFLHVEDVAAAFVELLVSDADGPVNIASGEPVSLADLLSLVGAELGRPELLRFGEVATPRDEPPLLVADVTRLREEVGWKPAIPLPIGIRQTIEWWRQLREPLRSAGG